jgi:hypothetical protein
MLALMLRNLAPDSPTSRAAIVDVWAIVFAAYSDAPRDVGRDVLLDLASPVGVSPALIEDRLARGWSVEVLGALICGLLLETSVQADCPFASAVIARYAYARTLLRASGSSVPCSLARLAAEVEPSGEAAEQGSAGPARA